MLRVGYIALLCAGMLFGASCVRAETTAPRSGLMWNRTGLPAVFPLLVKSAFGQSYMVVLRDSETDAPALAAFFEGGAVFRVLVPPGSFRVRFYYGQEWQSEDTFFGPDTGVIDLEAPLTFAVRGFAVKGGHLVDIRDAGPGQVAQVDVKPSFDCQRFAFSGAQADVNRLERFDYLGETDGYGPRRPFAALPGWRGPGGVDTYRRAPRVDRRFGGFDQGAEIERLRQAESRRVQSRPC
ncbi:hypothetical protein [Sulfitobacter sp. S190]|uniref:hypothetical protein n=1 Tax=Sulfitobacter sp. S190 TaxID=2867022 RepID=UPI0021A4804F|nr:hypothetical protein [Sulfitobacter sp. S190]UWR22159.1 hypothetical protein K3756_16025 [Sulfitobacter sp. S190]